MTVLPPKTPKLSFLYELVVEAEKQTRWRSREAGDPGSKEEQPAPAPSRGNWPAVILIFQGSQSWWCCPVLIKPLAKVPDLLPWFLWSCSWPARFLLAPGAFLLPGRSRPDLRCSLHCAVVASPWAGADLTLLFQDDQASSRSPLAWSRAVP